MSLSDWEFHASSGVTFSINLFTPIVSLGSGRLAMPDIGALTQTNINVTTASGRTRGVTRGKLRSLFRYDTLVTAAVLGLAFCQSRSDHDLTSNGTAYFAYLRQADSKLHISRMGPTNSTIAGFFGAPTFLDSGGFPFVPGNNVVFSLEVEWIVDIAELGGVAIFLRQGFATNFSDLTTVITVLDTSSPLTTSTSESVFAGVPATFAGAWNLDFDQTTLFIP